MILCFYGCGKEAKFQLKNGKWCCSNSTNKCEGVKKRNLGYTGHKHLVETRKKMRKNGGHRKGKHHSEESKQKMRGTRSTFIPWNKGKHGVQEKTKESIEKQRQWMLNGGANYVRSFLKPMSLENKEKHRRRMLNGDSKKMLNFITKESIVKSVKSHKKWFFTEYGKSFTSNLRKKMLDGEAVRIQSFIKNPSKPQVELYNRVKELYPTAILNYPLYELNYSLDIAIPDLKIWFESDGSWWHQNKEKDLERQRKIENLGWKCIRYKADFIKDIPELEKIKEDIFLFR